MHVTASLRKPANGGLCRSGLCSYVTRCSKLAQLLKDSASCLPILPSLAFYLVALWPQHDSCSLRCDICTQVQGWNEIGVLKCKGEMRDWWWQHLLFLFIQKWKRFLVSSPPDLCLVLTGSEWYHMTSSGCNAGWENVYRERQVGRSPEQMWVLDK